MEFSKSMRTMPKRFQTAALGFAVVVVIAACVLYVVFALLAHLRFMYIDYQMHKKHSKPKK